MIVSNSMLHESIQMKHSKIKNKNKNSQIFRQEGIRGLWRGAPANMTRVGIGSAAQLATYGIFFLNAKKKHFVPLHYPLTHNYLKKKRQQQQHKIKNKNPAFSFSPPRFTVLVFLFYFLIGGVCCGEDVCKQWFISTGVVGDTIVAHVPGEASE